MSDVAPASPQSSSVTDRNLLSGVLCLQADLIGAVQFAEACTAWTARKHAPLADILLERGWITPADRADVERLLERGPRMFRHFFRTRIEGQGRILTAGVADATGVEQVVVIFGVEGGRRARNKMLDAEDVLPVRFPALAAQTIYAAKRKLVTQPRFVLTVIRVTTRPMPSYKGTGWILKEVPGGTDE